MNLPAFAVKYLRKLLNYPLGGLSITPEEAKEGLRLLGTKKRSEKVKTYRRAARAKEQAKQKSRKEKSLALYAKVHARPGPDCELGDHYWPRHKIQIHHLKAGSAKRVTEAVHNLIRTCNIDHDLWHSQGPERFRPAVTAWCTKHGYPMPSVYTRRAA